MTNDEANALVGLAAQWDALARILGPGQKAALGKCSDDLKQLVDGLQAMADLEE